MIKAYINQKGPCITIHRNPLCDNAKVGPEEKIRHVMLNPDSLSKELVRFRDKKHRFAEEDYMNDMWLIFDFQDPGFEIALLSHIQKLIGLSNETIKACMINEHC